MIKSVVPSKVLSIFPIHGDITYHIPKYQREYTWGLSEWNALFYDVTENEKGYFLGSYICVNRGSLNGTVLEVIDGQQRFTTIILLLAALYKKLNELEHQMNVEQRSNLTNLRCIIANQKHVETSDGTEITQYAQRLILQKQNMNDADFSFVLSDIGVITEQKEQPRNFGNRRISKAYKHFGKLIDDEITNLKKEKPALNEVNALFSIVRKFEDAIIVGIEVYTNKDAYMLFESLNHRGVPLSAIDLIKNTLIASAESKGDADNSYEIWKQILSNVGQDDYSLQERFFRQYYNSFRDELNKHHTEADKKYYFGYLATRTTLLDIYEKMIKDNYQFLLNDLLQKSKIYALITNNSENEYVYTTSLLDLERIAGSPSYILLLYVMSNKDTLNLTDESLDKIIKLLITFFVRRNVTDIPSTRKLTQLFIDIVSVVKSLRGEEIISTIQQKMISVSAPDDIFESKLRGSIYDENPEATRFILCSIESSHRTKEIYSDLWARDKNNKYVWTIEHIFPEGENIPESWVEMIANGDRERAKQYRTDYVHTLGNLTITGYNQNLSNMSFERKKDRQNKDNKEIGYRNGLFLNQNVVNEKSWTIDLIKKRTDELVNILMNMYRW